MSATLRDKVLNTAVSAGKIAEGQRGFYRGVWDQDPTEAAVMIASLPAGKATQSEYDPTFLTVAERSRLSAGSGRRTSPVRGSGQGRAAKRQTAKAPKPQPAPAASSEAEYPAGWLTAGERAHVEAVRAGRPFPTIGGESQTGEPVGPTIASAGGLGSHGAR